MNERIPDSMDEQESLDRLLDRALATYTPANARPGFEDRVRATITAEESSRPQQSHNSWRWVWALTVAAAVLLVVVLKVHLRPTPDSPTTGQTLPAPPVPQPPHVVQQPVAAHNPSRSLVGPRRSHQKRPEVLERGPSQEQLIAQVLATSPQAFALMAQTQKAVADPDKPIEIRPLPDDPIVIAPLEIKPLEDRSAETGGRF